MNRVAQYEMAPLSRCRALLLGLFVCGVLSDLVEKLLVVVRLVTLRLAFAYRVSMVRFGFLMKLSIVRAVVLLAWMLISRAIAKLGPTVVLTVVMALGVVPLYSMMVTLAGEGELSGSVSALSGSVRAVAGSVEAVLEVGLEA